MDASLLDGLVMTLFSAVVCVIFPRMLTLIGSSTASKTQQIAAAIKSTQSDSSESTVYPELTAANN